MEGVSTIYSPWPAAASPPFSVVSTRRERNSPTAVESRGGKEGGSSRHISVSALSAHTSISLSQPSFSTSIFLLLVSPISSPLDLITRSCSQASSSSSTSSSSIQSNPPSVFLSLHTTPQQNGGARKGRGERESRTKEKEENASFPPGLVFHSLPLSPSFISSDLSRRQHN